MTGNYNEETKKKGKILDMNSLGTKLTYELRNLTGSFPTDSDCATSMSHYFLLE